MLRYPIEEKRATKDRSPIADISGGYQEWAPVKLDYNKATYAKKDLEFTGAAYTCLAME